MKNSRPSTSEYVALQVKNPNRSSQNGDIEDPPIWEVTEHNDGSQEIGDGSPRKATVIFW